MSCIFGCCCVEIEESYVNHDLAAIDMFALSSRRSFPIVCVNFLSEMHHINQTRKMTAILHGSVLQQDLVCCGVFPVRPVGAFHYIFIFTTRSLKVSWINEMQCIWNSNKPFGSFHQIYQCNSEKQMIQSLSTIPEVVFL